MKKTTIELDQDFIDKIVLDELKDYRQILHDNLDEYYVTKDREPYMREDINDHIRTIAALDVVIAGYEVASVSL
jgi:hypothetical protein